jgi:hypothetical protein
MTETEHPEVLPEERPLRRLLSRDGLAALFVTVATLAVELGTFFLARGFGVSVREAVLATLAASAIWVVLSVPAMAASGSTAMGALLRGGIVADTSAVTLIVLCLATPFVTVLAALKIYCVLAAVALACVAAVRCARSRRARCAAALVTSVAFCAALATPFWTGGLLQAGSHATRQALVRCAVSANPLYSIFAAVVEQTGFIWHVAPRLYAVTRIGDAVAPPPPEWYSAALVYGLVACILAATHLVRRPQRDPA